MRASDTILTSLQLGIEVFSSNRMLLCVTDSTGSATESSCETTPVTDNAAASEPGRSPTPVVSKLEAWAEVSFMPRRSWEGRKLAIRTHVHSHIRYRPKDFTPERIQTSSECSTPSIRTCRCLGTMSRRPDGVNLSNSICTTSCKDCSYGR